MSLTEFGALVRKARIDARVKSLGQMADELKVSAALLSGMETGRRKISEEWVTKISAYFSSKGVTVPGIGAAADLANKQVSLEGMPADQQLLIAGFARARNIDQDTLERLKTLLEGLQNQQE